MPQKPNENKESKSLIERGLEALMGKENMDIDLVVRRRGVVVDEYLDDKGNILRDGPFSYDSIACQNGATPTNAQVQKALSTLIATEPNQPGSDNLFFNGVNPIAAACNIAPRPRKGRTPGN